MEELKTETVGKFYTVDTRNIRPLERAGGNIRIDNANFQRSKQYDLQSFDSCQYQRRSS